LKSQQQQQQQQLLELTEKLLPLDIKIDALSVQCSEQSLELDKQLKLLTASQKALDNGLEKQQLDTSSLNALTLALQKQQDTQALQETLPVIEQQFSLYIKQQAQLDTLQGEYTDIQEKQDIHNNMLLEHQRQADEQAQRLETEKSVLQALTGQKEHLLENAQFSRVHQVTDVLTEVLEQQTQNQQALALVRQLDGTALRLSETQKSIAELQENITENQLQLNIAEQAGQAYKTEKLALQKLLEQEQVIAQLSDFKKLLQAEQPCPLCGSLEHPAILDYQPLDVSETQSALQQKELQLSKARDDYRDFLTQIKADSKQLEIYQRQAQQLDESYMQLLSQWQENGYLAAFSYNQNSLQELQLLERSLQEKRKHIEALQKQLQQIEAELPIHQQAVQKLTLQVNNNDNRLEQLSAQNNVYEAQRQRLSKEREALSVQLEENRHAIAQQLPESLLNDAADLAKLFAEPLLWIEKQKRCIELYQSRQGQRLALQTQLENQKHELALLQQQHAHLQKAHLLLQQQWQSNRDKLQQLQSQRHADFGVQSQQQIRETLELEKLKLMQSVEAATQSLHLAEGNYERLSGQLAEQNKQLQVAQKQQQKISATFASLLADSVFTDQQQFMETRLSDSQLSTLLQQQKQINEQLLTEQTRYNSINQRLQEHLSLSLTEKNAEILQEELTAQKAVYEQLNEQQLEIKGQLQADLRLQAQQAELLIEQQKQQALAEQWALLNKLIGAADGSKFRTFAQGMTLDNLIYLANQEMANLHQRYQLQRNIDEPLALQVIDLWQANSVRDVKTLSGGESFLVSLGLALALSNLASQKTKIESLFLDEGFGTLDANTLEVALDALEQLNATGKLIGVISHVEALKERISTQIHVRKSSGAGYSKLDPQYRFVEEH
ncbi:MAG: chromosome segregation protein SMC, partial [Psychromonas sp.]|nr:chromosome segregation protein SMC [Psychromonas sp.]